MTALLNPLLPLMHVLFPIVMLFAAAVLLRWTLQAIAESRQADASNQAEADRVGKLARQAESERLIRDSDTILSPTTHF